MQINTQSSMIPAITYKVNNTSVNTFDVTLKDKISFTQLPSNKIDAATLQPMAVFEKDKEIAAIVNAAEAITTEHDNYQTQFVEGGRKALYEVLSKIYALALQINISDYRDSILKELRNQLSLKKKIKTQKNSNAITMLVRWVVGANRQTAHNYSKALQAAFNDNITAENISVYFAQRGGLQSVKSEGQKKVNEAKQAINFEFERFVQNVDKNHKGYTNTKIEWTEEIYGEGTTGEMMILGHWSGGSIFTGYRAFHLSKDAYQKICSILASEVFNNQSIEAVSKFVDNESILHYKIAQSSQ
jgi:hypothetical protein